MPPKPTEIALELGTPPGSRRTSEEFEQVSYPANSTFNDTLWGPSHRHVIEEELPLHYMNDERARRRVKGGAGSSREDGEQQYEAEYDEKASFHDKARVVSIPRIARNMRRNPPPPTNLVR